MKMNRKDFRGELYSGPEYVGHIFKVEGGYSVFAVNDGIGSPLFDGKVFQGSDFRKAGSLHLSASRSVAQYEVAA